MNYFKIIAIVDSLSRISKKHKKTEGSIYFNYIYLTIRMLSIQFANGKTYTHSLLSTYTIIQNLRYKYNGSR